MPVSPIVDAVVVEKISNTLVSDVLTAGMLIVPVVVGVMFPADPAHDKVYEAGNENTVCAAVGLK